MGKETDFNIDKIYMRNNHYWSRKKKGVKRIDCPGWGFDLEGVSDED